MAIKGKPSKTYVPWIKSDLDLLQRLRSQHPDIGHAHLRRLFNAEVPPNRERSIDSITNKVKRLGSTETVIKNAEKTSESAKAESSVSISEQTPVEDFLVEYDHIMPSTDCMALYQNYGELPVVDMMNFYGSYDSQLEMPAVAETLEEAARMATMAASGVYYV